MTLKLISNSLIVAGEFLIHCLIERMNHMRDASFVYTIHRSRLLRALYNEVDMCVVYLYVGS